MEPLGHKPIDWLRVNVSTILNAKNLAINSQAIPNILALLLWLFLGVGAITRLDLSWDSLAYHLPFASRLGGIFPKSEYLFYTHLESLFEGGPRLAEYAQGVLWRMTGMVSAANLFGLFCIVLLTVVTARKMSLPFWLVTLFFLSIPLVLIHSETSYTDLPANAFIVLAFVNLIASSDRNRFDNQNLFLVLFPLCLAANTKFQAVPIAIVFWGSICFIFIFKNRNIVLRGEGVAKTKYLSGFLIVSVTIAFLIGGSYIVNFVRFQNPFYPLTAHLGPVSFNGAPSLPAVKVSGSLSVQMDVANDQIRQSQFATYLVSLFEIPLWTENTGVLWTVDMGTVWGGDKVGAPYFKTGGFFVANLILWGSFLLASFSHLRTRKSLYLFLFVLGNFAFVGLMPASFELRYWLFLPLELAVLTLWVYKENRTQLRVVFRLVVILQLVVFSFVAYHAQGVFPNESTFRNIQNGVQNLAGISEQYKLKPSGFNLEPSSYVCIVGDTRMGFLYKISNPRISIQSANSDGECLGRTIIHPP